ncbi:MAG: hypothetical protein ACE5FI_07045, partial [Anaerolineales bacterium]
QGAVEAYQRAGAEAGRMTMRPLVLRACAGAARGLDALGRTAEAGAKREEAHAVIDEVVRMFDDEELRETYLEHAHHLLDGVPVA